MSLHFFSCKACNYVRKQFNTVLPHPRTLSKWYSSVNANPGSTEESLKNNGSLAAAKECLVIMVVSVNENWKLPIGYFLVNSLNSSQKAELVRHALNVLLNIKNLNVVSLTFNGCSTNVIMSQLLGCNFNTDTLSRY